jgi:serine/threonine protein kinase
MLRRGLADGVESGESRLRIRSSRHQSRQTSDLSTMNWWRAKTGIRSSWAAVQWGLLTRRSISICTVLVALKVIGKRYLGDESVRLRFLREARAAARLRHSNVASVLHLGRAGSGYFYAMEFVEGETLEKLIQRSGRLEVKLALEIATQVAAGLAAVHKQKLVHRDIKPSNVMVNLEGGGAVTAKIIDLGLAKPAPDAPADSAISIPGAFAGTPEFASPKQATQNTVAKKRNVQVKLAFEYLFGNRL